MSAKTKHHLMQLADASFKRGLEMQGQGEWEMAVHHFENAVSMYWKAGATAPMAVCQRYLDKAKAKVTR